MSNDTTDTTKKSEPVRLSEHFELSEFTRSSTAAKWRISNKPGEDEIENLRILCETCLEPIREEFGPVHINSGYRCQKLNEKVGGTYNSQHLTGNAADIRVNDKEQAYEWYEWIRKHVNYDQLILERPKNNPWIHISCKTNPDKNRHMYFIKK